VPKGWEPVRHSLNDFAYTKRTETAFTKPMFELPSWVGARGSLTPVVCQPNYPVKKAFRTTGLVRGKHPYALIVDDIQKGDSVHHYDWILALQADLQIAKLNRYDRVAGPEFDVFLTGDSLATPKKDETFPPVRADGPIKAGQPMLLVRVLSRTSQAGDDKPPAVIDEIKDKRNTIRRLVIPSDAVAPDYKVLLFAYKEGAPLPKTTWNEKRTQVTIGWDDQQDVVNFSPATCGKTNLTIVRSENGANTEILRIEKDTPSLPGPADQK
jgi:hypothetical protein